MDTISPDKFVLIQRGDQERFILLNTLARIRYGRGNNQQEVELKNAIGHPFYSHFEVKLEKDANVKGKAKKYSIQLTDDPNKIIKIAADLGGVSGKDNRNICDNALAQGLKQSQIASLREEGKSGQEIVETLVTNSKTFTQRTEFSQEKYLRKKEKVYGDTLCFIKPTLYIVADYYFRKEANKIMNLRYDALGQMLTYGNVHAGGNYLIFESGCLGLLVAATLKRLGGFGTLLHVHTGSMPQRQALAYMNLSKNEMSILRSLDVFYLIRNRPPSSQEEPKETLKEEPLTKKPKLEIEEESEENSSENPKTQNPHLNQGDQKESEFPEVYRTSTNRIENEESENFLNSTKFDGFLMCSKEHPLTILQRLLPHLLPSAPFAIFSQYPEPLHDCFVWLKEGPKAVNVNIFDNFLRDIQVDVERTHPENNMSGNGGYLLTGIYVLE